MSSPMDTVTESHMAIAMAVSADSVHYCSCYVQWRWRGCINEMLTTRHQSDLQFVHSQQLGIERYFALCCHGNAIRAPIADPPNSAQLGVSSSTPPSYIQVRAIVWACGRGQTHRHAWPQYISRCLRLTRNVKIMCYVFCHCWLGVRKSIRPVKN